MGRREGEGEVGDERERATTESTGRPETPVGPGRLRRWGIRPLVWAVVALLLFAVGLLLLLRREPVQRRLADFALARAEAYIGRDIDVGDVDVGWIPLWIEVTDVVVPGPVPEAPPVLTAERLLVDLDLFDLFDATLRVQRLEADGLHLYIARGEDGELNLPDLPQRQRGEGRIDFEIGTIDVEGSSFSFEDRTVPLDLLARGVRGTLLGTDDREVAGRAVVEEVMVQLPEAEAPVTARFEARLRIGRRGLDLRDVRLSAPDLRLTASGLVRWKEPKEVSVAVDGRASSELFRRLGYVDEKVDGVVEVDGDFTWHPGVWGFGGRFESERLRLVDWTLEEVTGTLRGDRNAIRVEVGDGRYAGGRVGGAVTVDLAGQPERIVDVELELDDVGLQRFLVAADIPVERLGGRLSGALSYRFGAPDWRAGDGWGDFRVEATAGARRVPITGAVPLTISDGALSAHAMRFTLPGQLITAEAAYDLGRESGTIDYRVQSADLGPLATIMPVDEADEEGAPTLWLPRSGHGELWGTLRLERDGASSHLRLELFDVEAPGIEADRVEGVVGLSGKGVERLDLELTRDGAAAIVSGEVPFEDPGWNLGLDVADWPLRTADPWLPFRLPVEGPFTGVVTMRGVVAPAGEEATAGEVLGAVAPAAVGGVEVGRLGVDLGWTAERVVVTELTVEAAAGRVRGEGELAFESGALDVELRGEGLQLDRPPLSTALGGRLAGRAEVRATIAGTLESPDVEAVLEGSELSIAGTPVPGGGETRLDLAWQEGELSVRGSLLGLASLEGGGRLDADRVGVVVELEVADLRSVARLLGPEVPPIDGHARGELRIDRSEAADRPEIVVVIDDLLARHRDREIVELEPIRVELGAQTARIRSLYLGTPDAAESTGSEVFVSGTVDLESPHVLDLNLQASVENQWIDPYLPHVGLTGRTDLLASVGGDVGTPRLNGQATVEEADLLVPAINQSIEEVSAVLFFYPQMVVVDTLEGEIGGGELLVSGRLDLPWEEEPMTVHLQTAARDVTLRYPEGWLLHGDANLVWSLEQGEEQEIRGLVTLDRAYYLRDVEIGVVQLLQRFLRRQRLEVGETDEALADVELAIVVEAPDAVRIRNNLADLAGSAHLTVRGTLARPLVFGEVEMDSGGELVYADNRYTVERAQLTFANPYRVEPVLDLEAVTEVAEYDVTLTLFGPLERLNASFASDPPLPDLEVLSLLLSGSPGSLTDSFARLDRREESSASAAEGLLFGQASSLIGERVGTLFGFDAFRIEPLASGGGTVSSARFTVGKRLSSDVYVIYSYDPTSTQEERVQVEWQVSKGLVVLVTQRGDEYSVDLLWEERF